MHAVAPHRLSDAIHTIHAIHKHVQCIHVRSRASYKELKLARNACSILATVAAMYTHVWIFIFPYFITGIRTSVFITDFRMKYGKSVLLGSSVLTNTRATHLVILYQKCWKFLKVQHWYNFLVPGKNW